MKKRNLLISLIMSTLISTSVMAAKESMSFFVTSSNNSGNLGGLVGADEICQNLASKVGAGNKTWQAYLSTEGSKNKIAVNARDRIGNGPWYNAKGKLIASNVADLHGDIQRDRNLIFRDTALNEKGELVNGRVRPDGEKNQHDMLTGSDSHGRAFPAGAVRFNNLTCDNWTNGSDKGSAMLGHHDRQSSWNTSWNSSHASKGCSKDALKKTGGAGKFYCFAIN